MTIIMEMEYSVAYAIKNAEITSSMLIKLRLRTKIRPFTNKIRASNKTQLDSACILNTANIQNNTATSMSKIPSNLTINMNNYYK